MSRSAFEILLHRGERKVHGVSLAWIGVVGLFVCIGLPEGLLLQWKREPHAWLASVGTLAVAVLMVLPFLASMDSARMLETLRRTGFLTDLQLTRLSARHLSDHLAVRALTSAALVSALIAPLMCLYDELRANVVLWVLLMLCATLAIAYLSQVLALSKSDTGLNLGRVLVWLLPLVSSFPLMFADSFLQSVPLAAAVSLLLLAGLSRAVAIASMHHGLLALGSLARLLRPSTPNRYIKFATRHPIVYRNMAQLAARVPGGWVGATLWRWAGVPLALLVYCACSYAPLFVRCALASEALALTYLSQLCWYSWRQIRRDQSRVELLSCTPLSGAEYVDGFILSALQPRAFETGIGLVTLAVLSDRHSLEALSGLLLVALAAPLVAYSSIYLAVRCKSLFEAGLRGMLGVFMMELAVIVPCSIVAGVVEPTRHPFLAILGFVAVCLGMYGWTLWTLRRWAIERVGGDCLMADGG